MTDERPHLRAVPDPPERRPARYTHAVLSADERGHEVDDEMAKVTEIAPRHAAVQRLRGNTGGDSAA